MWIHNPVMLEQVLYYLDIKRNDSIVDCTLGEGGHSLRFLEHLEGGRLLGIEQDGAGIPFVKQSAGYQAK